MTNLNKPSAQLPPMTVRLHDGTELVAQPGIGDMAKYDVLRARKGWPRRDDAEMLFMTGIVWIALRRTGQTSMTADEFIESVDTIDVPDADTDDSLEDTDADDFAGLGD
nr:MAG TPA_asm: hypothetical protein [Caudoviricetes sp.]